MPLKIVARARDVTVDRGAARSMQRASSRTGSSNTSTRGRRDGKAPDEPAQPVAHASRLLAGVLAEVPKSAATACT
jgi:hypothetical protein